MLTFQTEQVICFSKSTCHSGSRRYTSPVNVNWTQAKTPVYIDVERCSRQGFLLSYWPADKSGDSYVQHSFWANDLSEEKEIWACFLNLFRVENPRSGSLRKLRGIVLEADESRCPEAIEDSVFLDRLIAESVNILSVIYTHIYFPTYSNGLKDIARYLRLFNGQIQTHLEQAHSFGAQGGSFSKNIA